MQTKFLAALAIIAIAPAAFAATESAATENLPETAAYQAVESFSALGGLHSFRALDKDRLIVWRTPFEPYLVELAFPSHDLRFAEGVAIDSTTSRVHSRFDTVLIRGIKYPIGAIYKLSREQAKAL